MTRSTPATAFTRASMTFIAATLTMAVTTIAVPGTAMADGAFAPTVTPTSGLDPAGDSVEVTLTGLPTGQGVFVRFCAQPQPGTRPAPATCDGQGVWAVENFPFGPPPTDGSVVKPSSGPVTLPVRGSFAGIDCTTVTCGVFTRRDSLGGATDRSLDTFTPVTFAVTPSPEPVPDPEPVTPSPEPEPVAFGVAASPTTGVAAGAAVAVSVTGVPVDQGLYVRWCVQTSPGVRPTADQCDGQGVWALESFPFGPRPTDGSVADPTAGPISLVTKASIGGIDCTTSVCGVSTRRDHRGPADPSMDTFTAVALAIEDAGEPGDGDGGPGNGGAGNGEGTNPDEEPTTEPIDNATEVLGTQTSADADSNTAAGTSAGALPTTGTATISLLPWAAAALLLGASMVAVTRRRHLVDGR